MSLPRLNPVEPPWYGPVCPVVGEGWHREVPPYPDLRRISDGRRAMGMVRSRPNCDIGRAGSGVRYLIRQRTLGP